MWHYFFQQIETNVGKCEPVSRAVDASVLALCKKMTLPFNGFWLSMVAILILFIPTTLSAFILSNLYSKLKADPVKRHTVDSNMPVDMLDGDDVPLSHVTNKHESPVQSYILDARHTPLSHYTGHSCHASAPFADHRDRWESPSPLYNQPPPYHFSWLFFYLSSTRSGEIKSFNKIMSQDSNSCLTETQDRGWSV